MPIGQARLCMFLGRSTALIPRQINLVARTAVEGQRYLTTNPQYKKPFPYKQKRFGLLRSLTEYTCARLNENSRILMIEGPPCVGKTEFAKNLAEYFKLKYLPAITEEDLFVINGFDTRQLNELMSAEKLKSVDLDMFYAEPDPKNVLTFGATQIQFFQARYYQYVEALQHVLHTGQGVVLENNVWSDACYALNMADHGYFSKKGIQWYMDYRRKTLDALWKPHLIIHLDAPSSHVVKKMKEKHPQYENSPVLRESYFDGLREKYQTFYQPYMEQFCDMLYYDVSEMEDFELLAMDLESMDLISARFGEGVKFADWHKDKEEQWSMYRIRMSNRNRVQLGINWRDPWDVPELVMDGSQLVERMKIRDMFPQLKYSSRYTIPEAVLRQPTPLSPAEDDPIFKQDVQTAKISA